MNNNIYIETYGCQMNLNDTEIISAILLANGNQIVDKPENASVIFLNTCSVREHAEKRIFERLIHLKQYKKKNSKLIVGLLGCMAESLKEKLLDNNEILDLVVGPDEYRQLPDLIESARFGKKLVATKINSVELYDDLMPNRPNGVTAWISIMRGCNNFCSYCVVPYTRGTERSRPFNSILKEVELLNKSGYKEITLLGQNVNSYIDNESRIGFPALIDKCAQEAKDIRFRFITSHPRDFSDDLIEVIAANSNICKHIHLPLQSGANRVLELMNRAYTIEHYIKRINALRKLLAECALTTDLITGFPTETKDEHEQTLAAMKEIRFDGAFMFKYSPRRDTYALKYNDDINEEEKSRRLTEIISLQQTISKEKNKSDISKIFSVLVESISKRNKSHWQARTDTNKTVIFPDIEKYKIKIGDFIQVQIERSTAATLIGNIV